MQMMPAWHQKEGHMYSHVGYCQAKGCWSNQGVDKDTGIPAYAPLSISLSLLLAVAHMLRRRQAPPPALLPIVLGLCRGLCLMPEARAIRV